jgi:predicted transcriptional regulator
MLSQTIPEESPKRIRLGLTMQDALKQAENSCKTCKTSSPIVCVERCDVWRLKSEILSTRQKASEKGHVAHLLNAVKNPRRRRLLDMLCEHPSNLTELQTRMKREGFYHSKSTIGNTYVKPLISAGLVREDGGLFRVTFYGRKVDESLHGAEWEKPLPIHSCCYEEVVVEELAQSPKNFNQLAEKVPRKSLSRILMRLRTKGILQLEKLHEDYVFYAKAKGKPGSVLSPTEKRILDILPTQGVAARQLSKEAQISLRRTYKYLHRLREKKLVFALKKPRTYKLTDKGREIARVLRHVGNLASSAAMIVLQR